MIRLIMLCALIICVAVPVYAAPGQFHYVNSLQANVYDSPSNDARVKFVIAVGRKVVEFERKNGFVNVGIAKSGGKEGWVKVNDLSPSDPDGLKY